jgi:hypothetical protein
MLTANLQPDRTGERPLNTSLGTDSETAGLERTEHYAVIQQTTDTD